MGGKVFKNELGGRESIRLSRENYFTLLNKFKYRMGEFSHLFEDVRAVLDKKSFGDMDILADCQVAGKIVPDLAIKFMKRNGDCTSFLLNDYLGPEFENFQVDIIKCSGYNDYTARSFFYQFGVFGNILGRICNALDRNLHFGHRGLTYIYKGRNNDRVYGEIILEPCGCAQSCEKFLKFMGLPTEVPHFNNFEEVYEFCAKSKFFNPKYFAYKNLDHDTRTRNRKRPDYAAFLDWLDKNKEKFPATTSTWFFKLRPNDCALMLNGHFPNFIENLNKLKDKEALDIIVKEKFNGKIVGEITGYENQELGKFMQFFKSENPFWRAEIALSTPESIKNKIEVSLASYKYGFN